MSFELVTSISRKAPSILYAPEVAAKLDRAQLASLGSTALAELDVAATMSDGPDNHANYFTSFEAFLVGKGTAGTPAGPRELLDPVLLPKLDGTCVPVLAVESLTVAFAVCW